MTSKDLSSPIDPNLTLASGVMSFCISADNQSPHLLIPHRIKSTPLSADLLDSREVALDCALAVCLFLYCRMAVAAYKRDCPTGQGIGQP